MSDDPYLYRHPEPLQAATFVKRPHRFCTTCVLDATGEQVESHLADPGRLKAILTPGTRLYLTGPHGGGRKLPYSTILAEKDGVGINLVTTRANTLFPTLLQRGALPDLVTPDALLRLEREVKIGKQRIDFRLHDASGARLVELKNAGLRLGDGWAMFPDAPSARAVHHLETLIDHVQDGGRASVVFIVGRGDVHAFAPARHIDPDLADALEHAIDEGVSAWACRVTWDTVGARDPLLLPIHLRAPDEVTP